MKTFELLIHINVPDNVTPEMIDITTFEDGYFIVAFDANSEGIFLADNVSDASIRYCSNPDAPTAIFIVWSTEDFESRALELEAIKDRNYDGERDFPEKLPEPLYDRSKFPEALRLMEHAHDCNNGITWETLDYYLDEYCLLK